MPLTSVSPWLPRYTPDEPLAQSGSDGVPGRACVWMCPPKLLERIFTALKVARTKKIWSIDRFMQTNNGETTSVQHQDWNIRR